MTSYFEESVEVERKKVIELTETVKYARKYFDDFSNSIDKTADTMKSLGVDSANTSKSVKDSISKIKDSYLALKSALTPFIKAFKSISDLTLDYTQQGSQIDNLVVKTGIASEAFQTLANASKKYNGSAEFTADTLVSLNKNIKDLSNGGSGNGLKDVSLKYNLDLSDVNDAGALLEVVADKMSNLGTLSEKFELGKSLGIDESIINLLVDGLDSYKAYLKSEEKYSLFTPEELELSAEFNDTLIDLQKGFGAVAQNISKLLLPILVPLFSGIKKVMDYFAQNSDLVKTMFTELAAVAIPALGIILYFTWGTVAPILAIIAAISAVMALFVGLNVLVKEFFAWISGKDSIFTGWLGDFETFKTGITDGFAQIGQNIVDCITAVWDFLVTFFTNIINFLTPVVAKVIALFNQIAQHVATVFMGVWNAISSAFGKIIGFVQDVVSKVLEIIPDWLKSFLMRGAAVGVVARGIVKGAKALYKNASAANGIGYVPFDGYLAELHQGERVLDKSDANIWRDLQSGKNAIAATANVPLASVPQGVISNAYRSSDVNKSFTIGDITIQTSATDADGIANDLMDSIKRAFNGLDTGVRA